MQPRTTIDLPDALMKRAKHRITEQNSTFRALVIAALEQELDAEIEPFELRDAAAGEARGRTVSNAEINKAAFPR